MNLVCSIYHTALIFILIVVCHYSKYGVDSGHKRTLAAFDYNKYFVRYFCYVLKIS